MSEKTPFAMGGSKRGAGESDLPDTAQVRLEDVKKLFAQQRGYLDDFFAQVRGETPSTAGVIQAPHRPSRNHATMNVPRAHSSQGCTSDFESEVVSAVEPRAR